NGRGRTAAIPLRWPRPLRHAARGAVHRRDPLDPARRGDGALHRAADGARRALRRPDRRRGARDRGRLRALDRGRRGVPASGRRAMRICGFEIFLVAVPSRRAHLWASKMMAPIGRHALLRLDTDEGVSGWGEAPAGITWGSAFGRYYGESPETVRLVIEQHLFPAVEG